MTIEVAGEQFSATGLMVTHRNFLEVYTYEVGRQRASLVVCKMSTQSKESCWCEGSVKEGGSAGFAGERASLVGVFRRKAS